MIHPLAKERLTTLSKDICGFAVKLVPAIVMHKELEVWARLKDIEQTVNEMRDILRRTQ